MRSLATVVALLLIGCGSTQADQRMASLLERQRATLAFLQPTPPTVEALEQERLDLERRREDAAATLHADLGLIRRQLGELGCRVDDGDGPLVASCATPHPPTATEADIDLIVSEAMYAAINLLFFDDLRLLRLTFQRDRFEIVVEKRLLTVVPAALQVKVDQVPERPTRAEIDALADAGARCDLVGAARRKQATIEEQAELLSRIAHNQTLRRQTLDAIGQSLSAFDSEAQIREVVGVALAGNTLLAETCELRSLDDAAAVEAWCLPRSGAEAEMIERARDIDGAVDVGHDGPRLRLVFRR